MLRELEAENDPHPAFAARIREQLGKFQLCNGGAQ
jgi:hypothetical protein